MKFNMKTTTTFGILLLLVVTNNAAPLDNEEEQSENMVGRSGEAGAGAGDAGGWDAVDAAALHKLLLQLDADDRFSGRVNRAWPQAEARGWSLRQYHPMDNRLVRQWRADKRQVRFRQCYFNPISCFRK